MDGSGSKKPPSQPTYQRLHPNNYESKLGILQNKNPNYGNTTSSQSGIFLSSSRSKYSSHVCRVFSEVGQTDRTERINGRNIYLRSALCPCKSHDIVSQDKLSLYDPEVQRHPYIACLMRSHRMRDLDVGKSVTPTSTIEKFPIGPTSKSRQYDRPRESVRQSASKGKLRRNNPDTTSASHATNRSVRHSEASIASPPTEIRGESVRYRTDSNTSPVTTQLMPQSQSPSVILEEFQIPTVEWQIPSPQTETIPPVPAPRLSLLGQRKEMYRPPPVVDEAHIVEAVSHEMNEERPFYTKPSNSNQERVVGDRESVPPRLPTFLQPDRFK